VQNGVHLRRDRHLDSVRCGKTEGRACGQYAFGHSAAHSIENVTETVAFAQLDADAAVAGELAGAGEDEIA
jgi:hypothetical protein